MTRIRIIITAATIERTKLYLTRGAVLLLCLFIFPLAAHASPFDSGISSIQTLFTGTIARAASLIAIVIGGYTFAHGEPGAKKTLPVHHMDEIKLVEIQKGEYFILGGQIAYVAEMGEDFTTPSRQPVACHLRQWNREQSANTLFPAGATP